MLLYLVFMRDGSDAKCILVTPYKNLADETYELIHPMDDPYIDCIEMNKVRR